MEHRRRRPQGTQPIEAPQQETAQEGKPETMLHETPLEADIQNQAAQRRRRRPGAAGMDQPAERVSPLPQTAQEAGKTYTDRTKKAELRKKADRAGKTVLFGGKTVLAWLGGALLLAGMMLASGFGKLRTLAVNWNQGRKSRISQEGHAPQKDEFVLEAVRPEDYHGKAQTRNAQNGSDAQSEGKYAYRKSGRGAGTPRRPDAQQLLSLVFAGVAIVSACMIVSILWRTVRTNRTNKRLAELYAQASVETTAPEATPEMVVFMPMDTKEPEAVQTIEYAAEYTGEEAAAPETTPEPLQVEEETQAEDTVQPQETVAPMGQRIYHQVGGDALPQMEALYNENRDTVGWLQIENVLDLPVVYRNNEYYLTHDFYKQKNTSGTIFLDVNHPFKAKTQNLLLHGHNMKDGTMFGRLIQYETDLNYVKWHPFLKFDTLWRKEEYVIFAVLRVSLDVKSDRFFNYFTHATFSSDAEFESYIRQLQLRSLYAIPIDVKPTDALLTLSTCLEDDRLVIVGRRVREGETHTELRATTNLATRQ